MRDIYGTGYYSVDKHYWGLGFLECGHSYEPLSFTKQALADTQRKKQAPLRSEASDLCASALSASLRETIAGKTVSREENRRTMEPVNNEPMKCGGTTHTVSDPTPNSKPQTPNPYTPFTNISARFTVIHLCTLYDWLLLQKLNYTEESP